MCSKTFRREKAILKEVRDAIGFKQERGDSITISSGEFADEIALSTVPWYENSAIRELLGKLLYVCFSYSNIWSSKAILNRILVPVGGTMADGGVGAGSMDEEEEEDKIEVQKESH